MIDVDLLAFGGPAGDVALGVAGVAAVIFIFGGSVMLRAQRQRHQFQLAKAAIERGAVQIPLESPVWLQSMRAAVLTLTLGAALLITGAASCWLGSGVNPPAYDAASRSAEDKPQIQIPGFPPVRPPRPDPADERWHEARAEHALGLTALGCGVVLSMLGLARLGFSRVERRHELSMAGMRE